MMLSEYLSWELRWWAWETLAEALLDLVTELDDLSIESACRLASFDVVFRAGKQYYKPFEEIIVDAETIENIRIMVERSLCFFRPLWSFGKGWLSFSWRLYRHD